MPVPARNKIKIWKGLFWLFLAVVCIVFSSASKKVIEQKVNPVYYQSALAFNKKIKDGSRDRHEYVAKVMSADTQQSPADIFIASFFIASLVSLVLGYFYAPRSIPTSREQHMALAHVPLLLSHRRLQV